MAFGSMPECHRQTDRQTVGRTDGIAMSMSRVSIAQPRSGYSEQPPSRPASGVTDHVHSTCALVPRSTRLVTQIRYLTQVYVI